jgi:hypothetical protein
MILSQKSTLGYSLMVIKTAEAVQMINAISIKINARMDLSFWEMLKKSISKQ